MGLEAGGEQVVTGTCKNLEGIGEGDWSSACVLSRPNSLVCPFLQACGVSNSGERSVALAHPSERKGSRSNKQAGGV